VEHSGKKTHDCNRGVSGSSETVLSDIENNSLCSEPCALQTFLTLKQQHYTLRKVENVKKKKKAYDLFKVKLVHSILYLK